MVGVLLVFNFAMELFKAQMRDAIVASQDAPINKFLEAGDTAFLVIFTCELFMNMYAHWMNDSMCVLLQSFINAATQTA